MKKQLKVVSSLLTVGALTLSMAFPAFAEWKEVDYQQMWVNPDGTNVVSAWQWIDTNGDGTAACFYFDSTGAAMFNTSTPDGYTVDQEGRWVVDEVVQQKVIGEATQGLPYEGIYYCSVLDFLTWTSSLDKMSKLTVTKNANGTYHMVGGTDGYEPWTNNDYYIYADTTYGTEFRTAKDEYGGYRTLYYKFNDTTGKYDFVNAYGDGVDYFVKQ